MDNFLNPLGMVGSSKMIRDQLTIRYVKNISKNIKIEEIFHIKESFIFRLRIPSEKNFRFTEPVFYDILIEFYPFEPAQVSSKKIDKYGMRVFSNCATFIFNFTYVYGKMGSLFRVLPVDHYSELALKEAPDQANPYKILGIEKSIFYAITKIRLETSMDKNKIISMVSKKQSEKGFKLTSQYFGEIVSTQTAKLHEVKEAIANQLAIVNTKGVGVIEMKDGGKTIAKVGYSGKKGGNRGGALATSMKKTALNENKIKESKMKSKGFASNLSKKKEG